jgi:hypothetical protein
VGDDQGGEGKESEVSFTSSDFNLPNWIMTFGVWVTRMDEPCIALTATNVPQTRGTG